MSEVDWLRMDRRDIVVRFGVWTMLGLLALIPLGLILADVGGGGVAVTGLGVALLVTLLAAAVIAVLQWRAEEYRLYDGRLEVRWGVLRRQHRHTSISRIRTLDVSSNILQRWLGVATLEIGSAEDDTDHGRSRIGSIRQEDIQRMRRIILQADTAGDAAADAPARTVLAESRTPSLRFVPLSWTATGIAAAVLGIVAQIVLSPQGRQWLADSPIRGVDAVWAGALLIVGAWVFGVLVAGILHLEHWWSHRLEDVAGEGLHMSAGMFTRRSVTIRQERLSGCEMVEPLGLRLADGAYLQAVVSGMNSGGQRTERKSEAVETVMPFAPTSEVTAVAAHMLGLAGEPRMELRRHPAAARDRRIRRVRILSLLILVTALLLWTFGQRPAGVAVLVVSVLVILVGRWWAEDSYRNLGYGLEEGHVIIRRGTFRRSTVVLRRDRIIGFNVRQSWFQRRDGLVSLTVTIAAKSGGYTLVDLGAGEALELTSSLAPGLMHGRITPGSTFPSPRLA